MPLGSEIGPRNDPIPEARPVVLGDDLMFGRTALLVAAGFDGASDSLCPYPRCHL
jgi:hypothetical protein